MPTNTNISARLRLVFDAELRPVLIYEIDLREPVPIRQPQNNQQHVAVEAIVDPT